MGIIGFLNSLFFKKKDFLDNSGFLDCATFENLTSLAYRETAFWCSVNMVANAVSKCEIKTVADGKEMREREYYLWNIEPNLNQNSTEFIHKLITQLFTQNEALMIELNGNLLVADSFSVEKYAAIENIYTNVQVDDLRFNRSFRESEVMYFKLSSQNMKALSDLIYADYANLISAAVSYYKSNSGAKAKFKYQALPLPPNTADKNAWLQSHVDKYLKPFLEKPNSVVALGEGIDLEQFDKGTNYRNLSTNDIKSTIDDVFDFTARCFGIPAALLKGVDANYEKTVGEFLTFCIDPLVGMLRKEIVRKRLGKTRFSQGFDIYFDTTKIIHHDILSSANGIDKLISSGVFCVNDIRRLLGQPLIDEPWAWKHFLTKNYSDIEGGEHHEIL